MQEIITEDNEPRTSNKPKKSNQYLCGANVERFCCSRQASGLLDGMDQMLFAPGTVRIVRSPPTKQRSIVVFCIGKHSPDNWCIFSTVLDLFCKSASPFLAKTWSWSVACTVFFLINEFLVGRLSFLYEFSVFRVELRMYASIYQGYNFATAVFLLKFEAIL